MRGIILAGGNGTRLYPATRCISKHLIPIYDKPMVYYPLSTLLLAGIKEILLISSPEHIGLYQELLGDGSAWGITIEYAIQPEPGGIAQAFKVGESFIRNEPVCLILGDNILYGQGLASTLRSYAGLENGAAIFGYYVNDPQRYGVIEFDKNGEPLDLVEKPEKPRSHYAVIGLYFYDGSATDRVKQLKPSARGELEITDLNKLYLKDNKLNVTRLGRGVAWLDTGTTGSMLEAASFIEVLEKRQHLKIGCPEEIVWRLGYITDQQLELLADPQLKSGYGQYLMDLLRRKHEYYRD